LVVTFGSAKLRLIFGSQLVLIAQIYCRRTHVNTWCFTSCYVQTSIQTVGRPVPYHPRLSQ